MTDETGIIILPGGAGLLASEIKKVDQEAERYGIIEDQIVPPRVLVNGTVYEVTSDEEAITERDRIIGEWRAGLRTKPHEELLRAVKSIAIDASRGLEMLHADPDRFAGNIDVAFAVVTMRLRSLAGMIERQPPQPEQPAATKVGLTEASP